MKKDFEKVYYEVVDMLYSMIHNEENVLAFVNCPDNFIDIVTLREAWELSEDGEIDVEAFAEFMLSDTEEEN